jgi:hypothetical protein
MSTQEKSGGTSSSAFTKGEYTYRRRGLAVATGDIRITDPKPSADPNIVTDPQPFPRRFLVNNRVDDENHPQSRDTDQNVAAARFETFPRHVVSVAELNCNGHFPNGNGSGNRKRYHGLKLET